VLLKSIVVKKTIAEPLFVLFVQTYYRQACMLEQILRRRHTLHCLV
jgi:hypothetical protein